LVKVRLHHSPSNAPARSRCMTPHHLASQILGHLHRLSQVWIEGCVGFEHGAGGGEEAVADAAQGAAMGVAFGAQGCVLRSCALVVLDSDT
jgi:hypothetical protein